MLDLLAERGVAISSQDSKYLPAFKQAYLLSLFQCAKKEKRKLETVFIIAP
jgi:hypothetical protein